MVKKIFSIFLVIAVFLSLLVVPVACAPTGEEEEPIEIGEEIDMDDAINIVVEDILPDIPEVQAGDLYQCIKLDSSLPAGTTIEEYSGDTVRMTLDEKKFFFYLDLAPGEAYEHDGKYILVDMNGNHEEYDAVWWPLVDGEIPGELIPDTPDERDVIAADFPFGPAAGTNPIYNFPRLDFEFCEGFLLVRGAYDPQKYPYAFEVSYNDALYFFEEYAEANANECSEVRGLNNEYNAKHVLDEIKAMADAGFDPITIFITGHGGVDAVNCGGKAISANDFCTTMAAYSGTTFNFILHSCHSGSFIDDLDALDNVCVAVTACASNQIALAGDQDEWCCGSEYLPGLTDVNQYDEGHEWVSSILEAMSEIVSDENKFDDIREWADEWNVPETSALILAGHFGAIGRFSYFGLTQDLDLTHRMGYIVAPCPPRPHDPQMLCPDSCDPIYDIVDPS
jgi:hypothetical protein